MNRRINLKHLPGTFTYFPAAYRNGNCAGRLKKKHIPIWHASMSPFDAGIIVIIGCYEIDCSLILGVTNVMLLIWAGDCIRVITIILCIPELCGDVASWACHPDEQEANYVGSEDKGALSTFKRVKKKKNQADRLSARVIVLHAYCCCVFAINSS